MSDSLRPPPPSEVSDRREAASFRLFELTCQGCGRTIPGDSPSPFRCPAAGTDGGDHVLGRRLSPYATFPRDADANPFIRYRTLTHAYSVARSRGMTDDAFVTLVRDLDRAIAEVCGRGFEATRFSRSAPLSDALGLGAGGVWIKDETHNVSGSHKGRHLMGLAILGEVHARTGIGSTTARFAIASCGNAALAAAVVARASDHPLDVFIPPDANPRVVAELERLGATVNVRRRIDGVRGDPCYHAFRAAVDAGSVPFCCQGSDNGLTVEGGETLAWEIAADLQHEGRRLDRVFVQVGGGALASACAQGFSEARELGVIASIPRLHPVQTTAVFPLRRAWERMVARIGLPPGTPDAEVADRLRGGSREVDRALDHAAHHRADFMSPWESEPRSIAHGILDDETYDWLAVVRGTIESGGFPIVVDEALLSESNRLGAEHARFDVDATGSSGLAGAIQLARRGELGREESIAALFTGARR